LPAVQAASLLVVVAARMEEAAVAHCSKVVVALGHTMVGVVRARHQCY